MAEPSDGLWFSNLTEMKVAVDSWRRFWLEQVEHMTQALRQYFSTINVSVIHEDWGQPYEYEQTLLAHNDRCIWQRSTVLANASKPLIYARAAMTVQTISNWPSLKTLGNGSLGEQFLHRYGAIQRTQCYVGCLAKGQSIRAEVPFDFTEQRLWARCSLFCYKQTPLMTLTEVLLPGLMSVS